MKIVRVEKQTESDGTDPKFYRITKVNAAGNKMIGTRLGSAFTRERQGRDLSIWTFTGLAPVHETIKILGRSTRDGIRMVREPDHAPVYFVGRRGAKYYSRRSGWAY